MRNVCTIDLQYFNLVRIECPPRESGSLLSAVLLDLYCAVPLRTGYRRDAELLRCTAQLCLCYQDTVSLGASNSKTPGEILYITENNISMDVC
jgi:hypothetical protein